MNKEKIKCPICENIDWKDFKVIGSFHMNTGVGNPHKGKRWQYNSAEQICCKKCDGLFTIFFNGFLRFKDTDTDFYIQKGWDSVCGLGAIGTQDQFGVTTNGKEGFDWEKPVRYYPERITFRDILRDKIKDFRTMAGLKSFLNGLEINYK